MSKEERNPGPIKWGEEREERRKCRLMFAQSREKGREKKLAVEKKGPWDREVGEEPI